jgi:peptidoglycan hydrolase-like protein with peptidoglycan-binding domain
MGRGRSGRIGRAVVTALVIVLVAGLVASRSSTSTASNPARIRPDLIAVHKKPPVTTTVVTRPAPTTTSTAPPPPLRVVRVSPDNNAQGVAYRAPVILTFNRAPGPAVTLPTISPGMPGLWDQTGDQLVFRPTRYWAMGTSYTVSVPGQSGTAAKTVAKFTTGLPSTLLLQQYLAMLGYLPLRFTPAGDVANRKLALAQLPANSKLLPLLPMAGSFTWAYPDIPSSLLQQWHRGEANVVTMGAVMQFEMAEDLVADGVAGTVVWRDLLAAVAKRQMDSSPYDYVVVSESLPETLYVWQDGKFIYNTLANTGVPGAYTPQGTWPVDYKQNPNLMKGCDVDGYCYSVWVAYASYFLPSVGDAIHAYPRYGYGYPQSNGCVEVEPSQGAVVYGYDPVGTLVTVSSWVGPAQ